MGVTWAASQLTKVDSFSIMWTSEFSLFKNKAILLSSLTQHCLPTGSPVKHESAVTWIIWQYFQGLHICVKGHSGLGWRYFDSKNYDLKRESYLQIPRAAFALALAPTVDGILVYLQARLRLRTRRNASFVFVGVCLLLASLTFGSTLLWWAWAWKVRGWGCED